MKVLLYFTIIISLFSCTDTNFVPKPPTYLRLELAEHEYVLFDEACPYTFEISKIYSVKSVSDANGPTCHKDIDLGPLNGTAHFSYINMDKSLSEYVNFANDKVDEHKIKATAINDSQIIRSGDSVFCTFFELQGDVASPFQFYMTDSSSNFVSCVIYFNSPPNYDSLKPSLDYLKVDLNHFITSFKWKK